MNNYFFRVRYTTRNRKNKVILKDTKDFKEKNYGDFFLAKDEAVSDYNNESPEFFAPIFEKPRRRRFPGGRITTTKKIFLIEILPDGSKVEHPWMGASEKEEDKELIELDRRIAKEKRQEINTGKTLTLEDYSNLGNSDTEWPEIPLSYAIMRSESGHPTESVFIQNSVMVIKHPDYRVSRQNALEEFQKLTMDPTVQWTQDGIANWDAEIEKGYILDLNVYYKPEGQPHTLYSSFIPLEEGRLENRKKEKKVFPLLWLCIPRRCE